MEFDKQKLLINYLISSQELYTKVSPILNEGYFDPRAKQTVGFIKRYYEEYKTSPTLEQIKAETKMAGLEVKNLTKQEIKYAENELEQFCLHSAMEMAVFGAPKFLAKKEYGTVLAMLKEAITVGLQRDIGIDYFADPELRLKTMTLNNTTTPTGLLKLDEYLGGGINRKEMIIFAAPSGVGKSITMSNVAHNLVKMGLNGVYFTMELSEEVVAKRFDSIFSGIGQADILRNITQTVVEIKKQQEGSGRMFIKRLPESSTNANHLRAYLKEFEIVNGFVPDFVVVDYLDLMASCQSVSVENQFVKDKYVSEELRAIANDYNCFMITASQLNRGAQQLESLDDLSQAHIAGGISKINTTDNLVAIIQNAAMKARQEMMFKLLKTRSSNGVGNYFMMGFDPVSLHLTNYEDGGAKQDSGLAAMVRGKVKASHDSATKADGEAKPKMSVGNIPFQV